MTKGRLIAAAVLLTFSGGAYVWGRARAPEVYVECAGTLAGLSCSVTHRAGSADAHVCWDFVAKCANGASITASACDDVQSGGKTGHLIPNEQIQNLKSCDASVSSSVQNLRVAER